MIKKLLSAAALVAATMLLSFTAFAANTISSVSVTVIPENLQLQPGDLVAGTPPRCTTSHVELSSYKVDSQNFSAKTSYEYDLTLTAKDGYAFGSTIGVSAKGCSYVQITALSSDSVSLKLRTYPFYRLLNPNNIEDTGGYATWSAVKNAAKYNIHIYYFDDEGRQKQTSKSTTETHYDYGDFMYSYGEAYISIQAIPATANDCKFMCPSEYIFAESGLVDTAKSPKSFSSFPSASISKGKKGTSSKTKTSNSKSSNNKSSTTYGYSGNVGPGGPGNSSDGWAGNGEAWVYLRSGKPVTNQWVTEADGNRYYLGKDGYMLVGWQQINGKWYYMDRNPDRKIGSVLTGWQNINEKWYYLEPDPAKDYGALYVNTVTPDGYTVDSNGEWIR